MDTISYLMGKKAGGSGGTTDYDALSNKPSINDVTLSGNKTTSDLHISYDDLEDKPTIPDISGKQDIIQYSTMPNASADNLGKIVQFIGTSDSTYTNGYFYKCISDEEETPTYSWSNINTQNVPTYTAGTNISITNGEISATDTTYTAGTNITIDANNVISASGGSDLPIYYIYVNDYYTDALNEGRFNLRSTAMQSFGNQLKTVFQDAYNKNLSNICILLSFNVGDSFIFNGPIGILNKPTAKYLTYKSISSFYDSDGNDKGTEDIVLKIFFNMTWSDNTISTFTYNSNNSRGYMTKYLACNNTVAYTPTSNYNPSTKKYVDDKPTTYAGYDATKTQVLKNINGTLTWVDE